MLNDQLYLPMKILYYSFEVELIHNNELNEYKKKKEENLSNQMKIRISTIHNSLGLGARIYFPDGNGI
jgi:hypothetical protein